MADHVGHGFEGVVFQRRITKVVLEQIGPAGFVLAGSGAIREHGITDRPTWDIDLFATAATGPDRFADAVATTERVLTDGGYLVTRIRSTAEFARLLVEAREGDESAAVEIDLAIDWRGEPPTKLALGPVLGLRDAVGSKIAAVYSRGEVRDYLDLDAIRQSGRFTDSELVALAGEHDPGFDVSIFIGQLNRVNAFGPVETAEYGVDGAGLDSVKTRLTMWAEALTEPGSTQAPAVRPPITRSPGHDRSQRPYRQPDRRRDDHPPSLGL